MRNRFFEKPTEDDIKEIGAYFCLRDVVIAVDTNDLMEIMANAENTIVLTGKATGSNRCADAIEDSVLHTCSVADGYDLFSAEKVLLYIVCPKSTPMLMSENEAISTFMEMFPNTTEWRWGLAEKDDVNDMKIVIIASNLQKGRHFYNKSEDMPFIYIGDS